MSPPSFPPAVPCHGIPFPPRGPLERFPRFAGTTRMLGRPAIPPASLRAGGWLWPDGSGSPHGPGEVSALLHGFLPTQASPGAPKTRSRDCGGEAYRVFLQHVLTQVGTALFVDPRCRSSSYGFARFDDDRHLSCGSPPPRLGFRPCG